MRLPGVAKSDQRFRKDERIRRRREYLIAQRKGNKLHQKDLLAFVLYRPIGTLDSATKARVGITVSKKVGNAVSRNRVKRWLREGWRQQKELFPPDVDIVVVAKHSAAEAGFFALAQQLAKLSQLLQKRQVDN